MATTKTTRQAERNGAAAVADLSVEELVNPTSAAERALNVAILYHQIGAQRDDAITAQQANDSADDDPVPGRPTLHNPSGYIRDRIHGDVEDEMFPGEKFRSFKVHYELLNAGLKRLREENAGIWEQVGEELLEVQKAAHAQARANLLKPPEAE